MRKCLLGVFALASMAFTNGERNSMGSLSIRPNPPVQGQSATLSGTAGETIDLDWDPPAEPSSVTLGADGKATFTVPTSATSLIATDPSGATHAWTVSKP
jgi:hypothetical protein